MNARTGPCQEDDNALVKIGGRPKIEIYTKRGVSCCAIRARSSLQATLLSSFTSERRPSTFTGTREVRYRVFEQGRARLAADRPDKLRDREVDDQ